MVAVGEIGIGSVIEVEGAHGFVVEEGVRMMLLIRGGEERG